MLKWQITEKCSLLSELFASYIKSEHHFWRYLSLIHISEFPSGEVLSILGGFGQADTSRPWSGLQLKVGIEAVSYTHLDVYKRQGTNGAALGTGINSCQVGSEYPLQGTTGFIQLHRKSAHPTGSKEALQHIQGRPCLLYTSGPALPPSW